MHGANVLLILFALLLCTFTFFRQLKFRKKANVHSFVDSVRQSTFQWGKFVLLESVRVGVRVRVCVRVCMCVCGHITAHAGPA